MTAAIKEPTVEEYLEIAKAGDVDLLEAFIDDCFGTDDHRDQEAITEFAKEVLLIIEEQMKEEIMKANEVPNEAIKGEATEVKDVDATTKPEAVEAASEATVEVSEPADKS